MKSFFHLHKSCVDEFIEMPEDKCPQIESDHSYIIMKYTSLINLPLQSKIQYESQTELTYKKTKDRNN